jgi:hypothetical protein
MSRGLRFAFWSVLITAILMGSYPPWKYTSDLKVGIVAARSERPAGYAFIADPPEPAHNQIPIDQYGTMGAGVSIDGSRLIVQYALLATITGGLFFALKHRLLPLHFLIGQKPGKPASPETPQAPPDSEKRPKPPTATARDSGAVPWWRFRSFRAEGFKVKPTLWVFSLVGGVFIAFTENLDAWLHGNLSGRMVAEAIAGAIGATLALFLYSLGGSYIAWRMARKSVMAAHVGGFIVAILIVAVDVGEKMQRHHQRQETTDRQRSNVNDSYQAHQPHIHYQAQQSHIYELGDVIRFPDPGSPHSWQDDPVISPPRSSQGAPVASPALPPGGMRLDEILARSWQGTNDGLLPLLPASELAKVDGTASIALGEFTCTLDNRSGWTTGNLAIVVKVKNADGSTAFSRILSNPDWGLQVSAMPLRWGDGLQRLHCVASLGAPLEPGQTWAWSIVAASGLIATRELMESYDKANGYTEHRDPETGRRIVYDFTAGRWVNLAE